MPTKKQGTSMQKNALSPKIVAENFARWNKALHSKKPKEVAKLYTEDVTFLPTMSPKFKVGKTEVEDYFKHFLKKNPDGKVAKEEVQLLSSTSYLHSGMYNFVVDEGGDRRIVEARFTFLWVQDEKGEWKIAHHHSSVKPQE
jgi:uncharacterized protein (TIGR02246 family)